MVISHFKLIGSSEIFTSNTQIFMPVEYSSEIQLRLDNNILFYQNVTPTKYELDEMFTVKGGKPIAIELGKWEEQSGFVFKLPRNRWDRRTDLKGATLVNTLTPNGLLADLIKDESGNITGSKGLFQDILFFITGKLNLTVTTTELKWDEYIYDRKEADVHTTQVGISLDIDDSMDLLVPVSREPMTLIAGKQRGTATNMWVYVNVFGAPQWALFFAFLILLVIGIRTNAALTNAELATMFSLKRGHQKIYGMDSALSCLALVCLYAIQMGDHTNFKRLSGRILTMTTSLLTCLVFVYYAGDITAKMTSGAPEIPVKNFEDVIQHDYKVIVRKNSFPAWFLRSAKAESAKEKVYAKYMADDSGL